MQKKYTLTENDHTACRNMIATQFIIANSFTRKNPGCWIKAQGFLKHHVSVRQGRFLTHNCHSQYRYLFANIEVQTRMRLTYRLLHLSRRITASKNEAEITCTFGQRYKGVMQFRCDLHASDQWHSQGFFYTMYTFEDTSRGNGNHHDSGSVSFAFDSGDFLSYGMTEN